MAQTKLFVVPPAQHPCMRVEGHVSDVRCHVGSAASFSKAEATATSTTSTASASSMAPRGRSASVPRTHGQQYRFGQGKGKGAYRRASSVDRYRASTYSARGACGNAATHGGEANPYEQERAGKGASGRGQSACGNAAPPGRTPVPSRLGNASVARTGFRRRTDEQSPEETGPLAGEGTPSRLRPRVPAQSFSVFSLLREWVNGRHAE